MITTFAHPPLSHSSQVVTQPPNAQSNLSFRQHLGAVGAGGGGSGTAAISQPSLPQLTSSSPAVNLELVSPDAVPLAVDSSQTQETLVTAVPPLVPGSSSVLPSISSDAPGSAATTPTRPTKVRSRPKAKSKPGHSLSPTSSSTSASPHKSNAASALFEVDVSSSVGGTNGSNLGSNSVGGNGSGDGSIKGIGGNGAYAMTYDSFWSSHSSSSGVSTSKMGGN